MAAATADDNDDDDDDGVVDDCGGSRDATPQVGDVVKMDEDLKPPVLSGSTTTTEIYEGPFCENCHTTRSPLWRRGTNDELLCNA